MGQPQTPQPSPANSIRAQAEALFDEAHSMNIGLSENDSDYNMEYLGEKLTKVSHYLEKLGDISMNLSKVSLEVVRQTAECSSLYDLKVRTEKDSEQYRDTDRFDKEGWLEKRTRVYKLNAEDWNLTQRFLREVREAVNERIQLFKRLDSDLRLQHRIIESREDLGGASPRSPGKFPRAEDKSTEVDIDLL